MLASAAAPPTYTHGPKSVSPGEMQQTPTPLLAANNDVELNRPWQHLSERMIHCNSLCTADLLRLPPRTVSGNHAISEDQPLKRQDVFGTYVTAVKRVAAGVLPLGLDQ